MKVKHRSWRLASLIAVSLVVCSTSMTQAGIIPWVYDAIFGPVRHPAWGYSSYGYSGYAPYSVGYTPYSVNYAPYAYATRSYSSAGCSTCSSGYGWAPSWGCGSCSSGCSVASCGSGCGTFAQASPCSSCGVTYAGGSNYSPVPCTNGCDGWISPKSTPAATNSTNSTNSTKSNKPATNWNKSTDAPASSAPKTPGRSTFQKPMENDTNDGLNDAGRTRGTRTDENGLNDSPTKAFKPTTDESDVILPKGPKPDPTDEFEIPKSSTDNNEAIWRLPLPRLNLDAKVAWKSESVPATRVPFHAKSTQATIARRTPRVETDWTPVGKPPSGPQLVKK